MSSSARLDAPALIATLRAAGCVFAEDEAALLIAAGSTAEELSAMVQRRVAGEPLEYILGWVEFHGLRIAVEPGVFVPRRRTEFLVDQAVDLIRTRDAGPGKAAIGTAIVLDLCCGSGAIGLAVVNALGIASSPRVELHAADVDAAAVRCARHNIGHFGRTYLGDLFDPLPSDLEGRITILTANVPYVPTAAIAQMPPEARLHEAPVALDGGSDGLTVLRRVSEVAARWLAPGGHLLVETSQAQAPAAQALFEENGLTATIVDDEERGATVVIGTRLSTSLPQ